MNLDETMFYGGLIAIFIANAMVYIVFTGFLEDFAFINLNLASTCIYILYIQTSKKETFKY